MNLSEIPIFHNLSESDHAELLEIAGRQFIQAGEALFREGEPADTVYVLLSGRCMLSREAQPLGEARRDDILDLAASLGGLAHEVTAIAISDCALLCWPLDELWRFEPFAAAARRYLASRLREAQTRLSELEAPVHYTGSAEISPGPFRFDRATMVIALCDADRDAASALLPEGLALLRRPGREHGSVFLALAEFPAAYPEDSPDSRFAYDETTVFLPVRFGSSIGLYVPFIYPSAWEPILLGREIYGFPKRLGKTAFVLNRQDAEDTQIGRGDLPGRPHMAHLTVDGAEHYRLTWANMQTTRESRLVRALSDWIGVEGRVTAAAFQAGEVLRQTLRLPPFRRVDVYNHKRVLSPDATQDAPTYSVDCLTRATFGVLHWREIARITDPAFSVSGGPLLNAGLALREAYFTRLDMRLSAGQVVRSYI